MEIQLALGVGHRHGLRPVRRLRRRARRGGGGGGPHHRAGSSAAGTSSAAATIRDGWERVLFGIMQGGVDETCGAARPPRSWISICPATPSAASRWASRPAAMREMTELAAGLLPADKPRYLMGVGFPDDILAAVAAGRGHVRLRAAHPHGPHRHGADPGRPAGGQEPGLRRGRPAPRRRLRLSRLCAATAGPTSGTCSRPGRSWAPPWPPCTICTSTRN